MGKVGRIIAGVVLTVSGIVVGVTTGNWTLAFVLSSTGVGLLTQPKPDLGLNQKQGAILENRGGALAALPVVYGTTKIAGVIVDMRVDPASTAQKRLCVVVAFCHGSRDDTGITAIDEIWFDDRLSIGTATVQPPFNTIVTGEGVKHLEFTHHLGTSTQAVDTLLNSRFASAWPSTSQGREVAYSRFDMWYNADIYPSGVPTIQAKIRGNKVFDPRDSTWKFSANPALCIRDYLISPLYGLGIPEANLDDATFIDIANYCEEQVSKPVGGTQNRYDLNGWVDTSRSVVDNLAALCTSCRARIVNEGDKWRIIVSRQRAVSGFKITEQNTLEGSWQFILPGGGSDGAANIVRVSYIDPLQQYEVDEVQWPDPGASNPYLTADNGFEQRLEMDLPYTDNRLRGQQIGMTILKETRTSIGATCTLKEEAMQCRIGDLVEVTNPTPGWVDKPFEVSALLLSADGSVQAVLVEYQPTAYDLDAQVDAPVIPATNLPNPLSTTAPTALTLDSSSAQALLLKDGTYVGRIKVTWTKSVDAFIDHYEVQAKKNTDTDWDSFDPIPAAETPLLFVYPVSEELWNVRIRAVNTLSARSAWVSGNTTVALPHPTVLDAQIQISTTGVISAVISTLNAASVRVVATVNGVEPLLATIRAATAVNTAADGRVTVPTLATATPGATVKIGVFAYESVAGGGRESLVVFRSEQVWGVPAGAFLKVSPLLRGGSELMLQISATGYASVKVASSTTAFPAVATGTCTSLDADGTTILPGFLPDLTSYTQIVFVTVTPYTGAGCTGSQGDAVKLKVQATEDVDQNDKSTGKRKRSGAMDDGGYNLHSTANDGFTAHSSVKESGAKPINRLYAKPLNTSPDHADSINTGVTQRTIPFTVLRSSDNFLVTGADNAASIGGRPAADLDRGMGTSVWTEVFNQIAPWGVSSGTTSLVSDTNATRGINVLQATGAAAMEWPNNIPFDPNKLYRFRARVRKTVNDTGGTSGLYLGLRARLFDGSNANTNSGANYVLSIGTNYTVAMGWVTITSWIKGATIVNTGAGGPASDPRFPTPINVGAVTFTPYMLINWNLTGSPVGGQTQIDYFEIVEFDEDAAERTYVAVEAGGTALQAGTAQRAGATIRNIASGREDVAGMLHGQTRSFPANFALPPVVDIKGGLSYQPASVWAAADPGTTLSTAWGSTAPAALVPQIDEVSAVSLGISGYTVRARLRQPSAPTARSTAFPAGAITTNGGDKQTTSTPMPAFDDTYSVDVAYSFQSTGAHGGLDDSSVSATVSFQYFNGSSWVTLGSQTDSDSDPGTAAGGTGACGVSGTFNLVGAQTGLTTSTNFRVLLTVNAGKGARTYSADPGNLTYTTSAGDLYANKTPLSATTPFPALASATGVTIGAT